MEAERPRPEPRETPAPASETAPAPKVSVAVVRCPYCHGDFKGSKALSVCADCLARHHAACWREHGQCASCSAKDELVPRSVVPRGGDRRRALVWAFAIIVIAALAPLVPIYLRSEIVNDRVAHLQERVHSLEVENEQTRHVADNQRGRAEQLAQDLRAANDTEFEARFALDGMRADDDRLRRELAQLQPAARVPEHVTADELERQAFEDLGVMDRLFGTLDDRVKIARTDQERARIREWAHSWAIEVEKTAIELLSTPVPTSAGEATRRLEATVALLEATRLRTLAGDVEDLERLRRARMALDRKLALEKALAALVEREK